MKASKKKRKEKGRLCNLFGRNNCPVIPISLSVRPSIWEPEMVMIPTDVGRVTGATEKESRDGLRLCAGATA